jgi:hypothetical protein
MPDKVPDKMEASFSILIMSIASSAVMAMGLDVDSDQGHGGGTKDKAMARFNIDLLMMLQGKTKNNLSEDESKFLASLINDLQIKFVQI